MSFYPPEWGVSLPFNGLCFHPRGRPQAVCLGKSRRDRSVIILPGSRGSSVEPWYREGFFWKVQGRAFQHGLVGSSGDSGPSCHSGLSAASVSCLFLFNFSDKSLGL